MLKKLELGSGFKKLNLLILGVHKVESDDFGTYLPDHTGAVTYIYLNGKHILVDTGSRQRKTELILQLEGLNLKPEMIDYVILTHFHLDHSFNVGLFENAKVLGWRHFWLEDRTERIPELSYIEELKGLKLFHTPGHAEEHLSVLIEIDDKNVVIAGDAINLKYVNTGCIDVYSYDMELSIKSAELILSNADIIIPGHGDVIFR